MTDAAGSAAAAALGVLVFAGSALATSYLVMTVLLPAMWVLLLTVMKAYEPLTLVAGRDEFRRVIRAGFLASIGAATFSFVFQLGVSRGYVLALGPLAAAGTLIGRFALRQYVRRFQGEGDACAHRVVLAGRPQDVERVWAELCRTQAHGYEVVGLCVAGPTGAHPAGVALGGIRQIDEVVAQVQADGVIAVPCPELHGADLRRLQWRLEGTGTDLLVCPGLLDVAEQRTAIRPAGSLPLLHVRHAELFGFRRTFKEVLERISAAFGLLLVAPLLVLLAVAIRLDSPGPALFRQERVGKNDRRFAVLKLRTMTTDAEARKQGLTERNESDGVLFKMRDDPRITRVGKVLRRYSLDELPQLVNVLRGEMSLVGPRPALPTEVDAYERDVRRRLAVKPGLTGLWQVSGRSDLTWEEAVRLDLRYVDNWSPMLDLAILWRTGRAVLSSSGAY